MSSDILATLDRLQALCDAATKGPWEQFSYKFAAIDNGQIPQRWETFTEADELFVEQSRTALPRALAALRIAVDFLTGDRECRCEDCRDIIAAQIEKALEGK